MAQKKPQPPQAANVRRQQETDKATRAGQNQHHVHEGNMVADQQRTPFCGNVVRAERRHAITRASEQPQEYSERYRFHDSIKWSKLGPLSLEHREGKHFGFSFTRIAVSERQRDFRSKFTSAGRYLDSGAFGVIYLHQTVGMIRGAVIQWRQQQFDRLCAFDVEKAE
jgi:hypothetical protein